MSNPREGCFVICHAPSKATQFNHPSNENNLSQSVPAGYLGSLITCGGASGNYSYTVASGRENLPVAYVSWFDAARFCNWLHNGQGNGSTESGAYTLSGAMSGIVQKNADAKFWIPTENEWYKVAYYDPTQGGTGGYWLHAADFFRLGSPRAHAWGFQRPR